MTNLTIAEIPHRRPNYDTRTLDWYAPESKPLSRKKLRQLMPLNHRNLTTRALEPKGHKYGIRNPIGAPKALKMSALDGFYVVKPRRVIANAVKPRRAVFIP